MFQFFQNDHWLFWCCLSLSNIPSSSCVTQHQTDIFKLIRVEKETRGKRQYILIKIEGKVSQNKTYCWCHVIGRWWVRRSLMIDSFVNSLVCVPPFVDFGNKKGQWKPWRPVVVFASVVVMGTDCAWRERWLSNSCKMAGLSAGSFWEGKEPWASQRILFWMSTSSLYTEDPGFPARMDGWCCFFNFGAAQN